MERPYIGISYEEDIPGDVFDEFKSILDNEKLNMMIESRDASGPMATYEWLIPTAVIAYIGKPYFDSFIKEMGKDHYNLLKKGFASLRKRLVGEDAPQVTIVSTAGKVTGANKYSLVFSIIAESNDRFNFKLLIQSGVTEEEYEKIVSSFIEFLDDYHSNSLGEAVKEHITMLGRVGGTVLCVYDFDKGLLELLDPRSQQVREES